MSEEREREELDVDETILQSSFTGYTSKLTDRQTGRFYAFVDFNENDIGRVRKCRHCLEYEIHNKLQPRILEKGQANPQIMINLFNAIHAVIHLQYMKLLQNLR